MKEELFKALSEEQMAKLKDCNNVEELLALAKQEGIELMINSKLSMAVVVLLQGIGDALTVVIVGAPRV